MKNLSVAFITLLSTLFFACNNNTSENQFVYVNTDSIVGEIIADTIIYDVIIKNTNPDDFWTEECLQHFDRPGFMDTIFSNIYNNKLKAIKFLSEDTLSIKEVKEIEQSHWYSRETIGKIQFAEIWYFSSSHMIMNKKILSMIFGVEQFDHNGKLKGYKPLFKIYLN